MTHAVTYDTKALDSALARLADTFDAAYEAEWERVAESAEGSGASGAADRAATIAGIRAVHAALLAKIEAADRLAEAAYRALPLMPALYANGTPCTEFGKLGETLADYRAPQPAPGVCPRCGGTRVISIGDGYSVNPCPNCTGRQPSCPPLARALDSLLGQQPAQPGSGEVVARLRKLEKAVEGGKHYGFQQDIWTVAADEIDRLQSALTTAQQRVAEQAQQHEHEMMETLEERDLAEEQADKLADCIANLLGIEIGEHTSGNAPWQNAIDAAEYELDRRERTKEPS